MNSEKPNPKSTAVGQYYLMEKIAQGGMAEIYKGLSYDVHGLKKTVCIKKILSHLSANKEFIDSLIDEAKLAVKLVHGNIAQTFDLGKVGDDYFMVMEFVDGKSLSQIHKKCMSKGSLIPIPFLLYFISEIANGLNYMHRRADEGGNPLHIIHRDISPQNIMVSYSGTVKIIDFGIAKATFHAAPTDSGILKGKFAYMSPEQAHGDEIDQRSDIFSLGIILHEMLTGTRLFKAEDSRQTIRNVRRAKIDPPSALRSEIVADLDRIVMTALSKDRRHRYFHADDMNSALIKFLHANYPEFMPSSAAEFVRELFKDEVEKPSSMEMDSKTPHLIIDRSNSALANDSQFEVTGAVRDPLNLKEYIIEDEPEPAEEKGEVSEWPPEEHLPLEADDTEEKTAAAWIKKGMFFAGKFLKYAALLFIAALSIFLAIKYWPESRPSSATFAEAIITTSPPDAAVYLDGNFAGEGSPVTLRGIVPGEEHSIEVKKDGFTSDLKRLKLENGEIAGFQVTLSPITKAESTLEILTNPPGATIYIDDLQTSNKTPATIGGLKAGKEITIGLHMPGHRYWTKKVSLKEGETKSFDVNLAKDFGSLSVDSSPPAALVMIDGVPAGQTPLLRDNLEPDKVYRIEVWHEGFETFAEEIKAAAGRKEEIRAVLKPEAKPPENEKAGQPEKEKPQQTPKAPPMIEDPAPVEGGGR